jgi:ABC-type phosphate transport system substrate-binding protein
MKLLTKVLLLCFLLLRDTGHASGIILWRDNYAMISMNTYEIQKIFTKKTTKWPDGQNINVFIKPRHSIEHRDFVINVLEMTPYYFEQQLESQTYSGTAASVIEVPTDLQMKQKIEQTPGSIGYVNYELYINDNNKLIIIKYNSET